LISIFEVHAVQWSAVNRVVQDWGKYLGDVTMASTILDRLMHRCVMLEFEGKSYRLKEAAARLAILPETS
jgi:DNA replication protein DnaC